MDYIHLKRGESQYTECEKKISRRVRGGWIINRVTVEAEWVTCPKCKVAAVLDQIADAP